MPFHVEITGKRRDTETVMRRLEGGDWKSASDGNSLVAYPTARSVLRGRGYSNITLLPDQITVCEPIAAAQAKKRSLD